MCLHEKKKREFSQEKLQCMVEIFQAKRKTIRWREHTNEMSLEEGHSELLTWPKRIYSAKANLLCLLWHFVVWPMCGKRSLTTSVAILHGS